MARIITSQQFLDTDVVEAKRAAADYVVVLSPVFDIDGEEYQVVLDGHHSLAASIEDGVDAEFEIATASEHDAVALIEAGQIDDFLNATHMGDDFIDAITRNLVW